MEGGLQGVFAEMRDDADLARQANWRSPQAPGAWSPDTPEQCACRPPAQFTGRAAVKTATRPPPAWTMPVAEDHLPLLDDDAESPYAIREPRELAHVLRALVDARAIITANLVPGGHACPTAVLAVDDDGTLVLDGHRNEAMNRRMANATRLVCSTQLDLVPIRFRLPTPVAIDYEGYAAFRAVWPGSLLRLQRREMYRLQVSPATPATLSIGDGGASPDGDTSCLRVLDISGGGLAIAVADGHQGRFSTASLLAPCLLRLAAADPFPVTLEVAHLERFDVRGVPHWRAGCRFIDMSVADEQRVLQYIFQVERQRNARQRRGG